MTQMYSSNYCQLPTEEVSNHTHHLDQGLFFCLFCQFLYIFFNHIFSKSLIDYYMLISMKIMLEKAPKTLTRLSDPGPIEKSPLCRVRTFICSEQKYADFLLGLPLPFFGDPLATGCSSSISSSITTRMKMKKPTIFYSNKFQNPTFTRFFCLWRSPSTLCLCSTHDL